MHPFRKNFHLHTSNKIGNLTMEVFKPIIKVQHKRLKIKKNISMDRRGKETGNFKS